MASPFQITTLIGRWPLTCPWVKICIQSWRHLKNWNGGVTVISDGTLQPGDLDEFGFSLQPASHADEKIDQELTRYPMLKEMRQKNIMWRKLLDASILNRGFHRTLLIDTDVLVRSPVELPDVPGMTYMRNDTSSYQGRPDLPWRTPLPRSLNAGFILFNPDLIDLDFLEWLSATFFSRNQQGWLVEQTAWAALAGREKHPHFWAGKDVRNISGFTTLTLEELNRDTIRLFSSRRLASPRMLLSYADDARILHFSGMSKHSWKSFEGLVAESRNSESDIVKQIQGLPDTMADANWCFAISLQLAAKMGLDACRSLARTVKP
jgi:hypothetical protein